MLMKDYEKTYNEFWKDLVEDEHGNLDKDKVMRELSDFSVMLDEVPKVYDHVTGGRISKPNTCASAVIAEHDNVMTDIVSDSVKDALECASE